MKNSGLFVLFAFALISQIYSQNKVEWFANFSSAGSISIDKAQFILNDIEGNVIVSGVTNGSGINDDITTIKYDKDGKQLWVAVFNGLGDYHDRPNGMAIDQSGNIYITGSSSGDNGTATNFITIKYNPSGIKEWESIHASKGGLHDESKSIAIDNAGNVYVTGFGAHFVTDNSGQDWITIKFNSKGEQLWIAAYDDGITDDRATVLTVDGNGNVYVTGQCNSPAYHIKTIKYSSTGERLWIAKYDGAGISSDEPADIKVDPEGNVYITGHSYEANKDFLTIKYDKNGSELWKKSFNGIGNISDEALKLQIDNTGNVYVLGLSAHKKNKKNRCLIKYDNSGNELWKVISEEPVSTNIEHLTMELDANDNILVTGSGKIINNKTVTYMMIDCYDKDGTLLWQTNYNRENTIPVISAISKDNYGGIYAAGYIIGTNGFYDYCIVKFSK
ncbi:MAG: SBBP repeat-containing protein [Ignavibacteria bacterium]|nr:SBBP repeat-containing protein [Ignavibacteria bacterium]